MGKSHKDQAVRDLDEWQVAETLAALEEARAGDFATEDEFEAFLSKWRAGGWSAKILLAGQDS
jgi:predicted transcriptional regulator